MGREVAYRKWGLITKSDFQPKGVGVLSREEGLIEPLLKVSARLEAFILCSLFLGRRRLRPCQCCDHVLCDQGTDWLACGRGCIRVSGEVWRAGIPLL